MLRFWHGRREAGQHKIIAKGNTLYPGKISKVNYWDTKSNIYPYQSGIDHSYAR
jgi:hypothetical protein